MGRDKAMLPHPQGGTWLEQSLRLLASLNAPISLFSCHQQHLQMGVSLAPSLAVPLQPIAEPQPQRGPLLALARLMQHHCQEQLLLCPVDMPCLTQPTLEQLLFAAGDGNEIVTAHDGQRDQPLLGLYPASGRYRQSLRQSLDQGNFKLLDWLDEVGHRSVRLPAKQLRNANRPEDLVSFL